ncbi:MAG: hypothetical protein O2904_01845 [bacterium]|nr:hypothetical protein [bacterium]
MMHYTPIAIGLSLLLQAAPVHALDATLYERIKAFTLQEAAMKEAEKPIEEFLAKIYPDSLIELEESDVDKALQKRDSEICRTEDDDKPDNPTYCQGYRDQVIDLVRRNTWLRMQIREWQYITGGYEIGIDSYPGRTVAIASRLPSILKIWQADTAVQMSPFVESKARGVVFDDPAAMETKFTTLETALTALDESGDKEDKEKLIAAVWRYRNGHQRIVASADCDAGQDGKGDGTELQFMTARWCDVEDALLDIYADTSAVVFDPPLNTGELALFPIQEFEDLNIYVWTRQDDVGLGWEVPVDNILPSLDCSDSYETPEECVDGAILGGTYPGELEDPEAGTMLCSHPFDKSGYLCRDRVSAVCPPILDTEVTDEQILLTGCKAPNLLSSQRRTESGPNMCQEGGWRSFTEGPTIAGASGPEAFVDTPGEEVDVDPGACSNCYVDLVCGCTGTPQEGLSAPKGYDESGNPTNPNRIKTCIGGIGKNSRYLIIHEVVHAQQHCNLPPGYENGWVESYDTTEGCCATEYQAYLASCGAMAEDGILPALGYSIDVCAAAFSDFSCGGPGSCSDFGNNPDLDAQIIYDETTQYIEDNYAEIGLPDTCEEAVNNLDPRAQKMINSMPLVCSPDCQTKFLNTIGNNLCFIGQCVEQSLEGHKLIPGRWTTTVQGENFPYESEAGKDPNLGAFFLSSPDLSVPFPPYRPYTLVQELDNALCQVNGLPKLFPPIKCAFDVRRRLSRQTYNLLATWQSLNDQPLEQQLEHHALSILAPGVGSRIGTNVYLLYFSTAVRAFEEIMHSTDDLLKGLGDVNFPTEMCERIVDI